MESGSPSPLDLTVAHLLERWPRSAAVLRKAGLSGCLGCAMAPFETLGEALHLYGLEQGPVLAGLSRIMKGARCRRTKS
jgi:hybrid cluster-associated redox disulfide protein